MIVGRHWHGWGLTFRRVSRSISGQLLADPKSALSAYSGGITGGDFRIGVIEQRSDTVTAVIPTPPGSAADSDLRLVEVSGRITTSCAPAALVDT